MRYFTFHSKKLSRVALGCDHFGETIATSTAWELLDIFTAHGGNVVDVAHRYGQTGNDTPSQSERVLGAWIKERNARDNLFLVTKGCHPDFHDMHLSRLDRTSLERDIQGSLEDLGVEGVDLWYFHRDNEAIPASELIDMANEFVIGKGYSREIGASNWKVNRIAEANEWAVRHGKKAFAMSEIQASLAYCTPILWDDDTIVCLNEEEMAWYKEQEMPLMCFSPQAKGLFSKKLEGGILSQKASLRFDTPPNRVLTEAVGALSRKNGVSPATIATSYLLTQHSPLFIPIIGASRQEQLQETLRGIDFHLPQEDLAYLIKLRGGIHG